MMEYARQCMEWKTSKSWTVTTHACKTISIVWTLSGLANKKNKNPWFQWPGSAEFHNPIATYIFPSWNTTDPRGYGPFFGFHSCTPMSLFAASVFALALFGTCPVFLPLASLLGGGAPFRVGEGGGVVLEEFCSIARLVVIVGSFIKCHILPKYDIL